MNKLFLLFFGLLSQISVAQSDPLEAVEVSVLTVGTADESHSLYGHTALRVKNNTTQTDLVYNYGMFDFSTPNFVLRFVKGDMQYFAAAYPYDDFEYTYRYENRSIYEQKIHLSNSQKKKLLRGLEHSIKGEEKFYTYKFIDRNCTTKVVEAINEAIGKEIVYKKNSGELTYREILYPYAQNHFFQKLGINIIFGSKVDQVATKLFLPFDLKYNLEYCDDNYQPLVTENKTIFEANRTPNIPWWDSIYTLVAFLTLIVIARKTLIADFYFVIIGLLGIFFSVVGFYSFHQELLGNYNILLFNPVLLLVVFFKVKGYKNAFLWASFIGIVSLIVYLLYMYKKIHLEIVWPFMIAHAVLLIQGLIPHARKK